MKRGRGNQFDVCGKTTAENRRAAGRRHRSGYRQRVRQNGGCGPAQR